VRHYPGILARVDRDTVFGVLFWAVVVVAITFCTWTGHQSNVRAKQAKAKQTQEIEDEFNQWCAANDTVPAFKDLPKTNLLTIDLQRALFVRKKRVAFKAQLVDLYRSEKRGTMTASFSVDYGDANIHVYLTCTEGQAQSMYDIYQREKDATLLIAGVFEKVEPTAQSNSDSDSESASDYKQAYTAVGTLVASKVAEHVDRPKSTSRAEDD
jgi:hypothetical protein